MKRIVLHDAGLLAHWRVTGAPVTYPNTYIGQHITIAKLPAAAQFKTQKGLQIFGPNYIGLDG